MLLLMQPPNDSNTKDWKDTMSIPSQKKPTNKFLRKRQTFPREISALIPHGKVGRKFVTFLKMSAKESQKAAEDSQNKESKKYSLWGYLTTNTVGFLFRLSMLNKSLLIVIRANSFRHIKNL